MSEPTRNLTLVELAKLMHDWAHHGYGPWGQLGGEKHRALDIEEVREQFAALSTTDEEHCCGDPAHMSPEYLAARWSTP